MHICYDDNKNLYAKSGGFNYELFLNLNPHGYYDKHLANYYLLQFIYKSTTNLAEKHQADKEMQQATKKMQFWEKHPSFCDALKTKAINKQKRIYSIN